MPVPELTSLRRLPKVSLHRHLEGSLRLSTLLAAARDYDLSLPRSAGALRPLVQIMPGEPRSAEVFLSKFRTLRQFFCSEALIRQMAREAAADAAEDGVRYLGPPVRSPHPRGLRREGGGSGAAGDTNAPVLLDQPPRKR